MGKGELDAGLVLRRDGSRVLDRRSARAIRAVAERRPEDANVSGGTFLGMLNRAERRLGQKIMDEYLCLTPAGRKLLDDYDTKQTVLDQQMKGLWQRPWVSADGVLVEDLKVLLVRRKNPPYEGMYALPGGFLEYGEESVEDTVVREVEEETGLRTSVQKVVGVYSRPDRDPRGHVVTTVFLLRRRGGELKAGDDAAEAGFFPLDTLPPLAFDHAMILAQALTIGNINIPPKQW
jgi:8-oxo-dGTP diphosphatase